MMKKVVCLAYVFALFLTGCLSGVSASGNLLPPAEDIEAAKALYQQALELHEEGAYEEAADLLTQVIIRSPFFPQYHHQRAQTALALGELELAQQDSNIALFLIEAVGIEYAGEKVIAELAREIEIARTGAPIPEVPATASASEKAMEQASARYEQNDLAGAIAVLDKAIAADPQNTELYEERGGMRAYLGEDIEKALTDFTYVLRYRGASYNQLYNCAVALKVLGRYDEALPFLDLVIAMDPEEVAGYYARGNNYYARGKYELAIEDYGKCVELDPEKSLFAHDRGDSYFYLGRYDEALADYHRALALDPDNLDFMHDCIRAIYAGLQAQGESKTKAPSEAQREMLARFSRNFVENGVLQEPLGKAETNPAGMPAYPLAQGVRLILFSIRELGTEGFYLLAFDQPSTLDGDTFDKLWQGFAQAIVPELDEERAALLGRMLGLSDLGAQDVPEDTANSAGMGEWQFNRMEYEGDLLLVAYQGAGEEALSQQIQDLEPNVYTHEALKAALDFFAEYVDAERLPALDLQAPLWEEALEDETSLLWRELLPGLLWGEEYNEDDGSFYGFRLALQTGELKKDAEAWITAALCALEKGIPPSVAAEYSHALAAYPSDGTEEGEGSRLMLAGRVYFVMETQGVLTLHVLGNTPEEMVVE